MTLPATLYPSQLNSVSTTLNGSLAQASTTVTVTTVGNLLPNSSCPYLVMIGPSTGFDSTTEICICTGVSGSVLTITRAQGGSTAPTSWASGSLIACNFSSLHWTNLVTDLNYLAAMPWTALTATTDFATTGASTSTVTMNTNQTGNIPVGTFIKYVYNGVTYRGIITALTSSLLTFAGPAIATGAGLLTALSYYNPSIHVDPIIINISGYFEETTYTTAPFLLESLLAMRYGIPWPGNTGYIVQFKAINGVADTGTAPILNVMAGTVGSMVPVSTSNSNAGISLPGNNTAWASTVVDINASNYAVSAGQWIELELTKGTDTVKAQNLTVVIMVSPA